MTGLELKQKAEEQSGEENGDGGEPGGEKWVVWEEKEWVIASTAALQPRFFLIRMSGGHFPLTHPCQHSG